MKGFEMFSSFASWYAAVEVEFAAAGHSAAHTGWVFLAIYGEGLTPSEVVTEYLETL